MSGVVEEKLEVEQDSVGGNSKLDFDDNSTATAEWVLDYLVMFSLI